MSAEVWIFSPQHSRCSWITDLQQLFSDWTFKLPSWYLYIGMIGGVRGTLQFTISYMAASPVCPPLNYILIIEHLRCRSVLLEWPRLLFIFLCSMNVSSWDEERLFVQPFIWQRNCKKRDLFNGTFSSQLGAVVGCVMAPVMTLIQWSNLMGDVGVDPIKLFTSIPIRILNDFTPDSI